MNLIPLPKTCCTCHITKLSVEFSKSKGREDGLDPRCKKCTNEAHKQRMIDDPDRQNRHYRENKEEFLLSMKVAPDIIARLEHRLATETKECKICKIIKPLSEYYVRIRHGRHINIRPGCKKCHNRLTVSGMNRRPVANEALVRYRKSANKTGKAFDLDTEFMKESFSKPCQYCDETKLLMTLDRKDSSIGYLKQNCVPCCIRCNLVKADMPYEAWLVVALAMKEALKLGLFGSWGGRRNFMTKASITK